VKLWYRHRFHTVLAHRIVFAAIPLLPRFLHPPIALVTAFVFFSILRSERRAVAANLRRVSGARGARLGWKVYRVFYSFCDLIVSYCYIPRASHAQLLSMLAGTDRGEAKIERCLAAGNGVIMWTAHLGNPEFASRLLEMHGRTVYVARVVEDIPAEAMLRDLMGSERLRIVDLSAGVPAALELMRALRGNQIVAIQGDRLYQRFAAGLPFFSENAKFPLGPFLLSQASGAPVLPGFVVRESWLRYRVLLGEPIPPAPAAGGEADLRARLETAVRFLERALTTYHDQWLNFFEFWEASAHE
jgi:KDO2-lipid IV(A) lauroyltransferase